MWRYYSELESSRMSLASRTDFEVLGLGLEGQVLGLGLEASSPRKLPCPRLEDSIIFWIVKILWSAWKIFVKTFFFEIAWKFLWRPFFFGEHLRLCPWSLTLASSIPVLGLESVCPRKGCPWPWPRIFLCPWPWPRALCPRLHLWYYSPFFTALNIKKQRFLPVQTPDLLRSSQHLNCRGTRLPIEIWVLVNRRKRACQHE